MARIFLCHANEDKHQVREVYQRLKAEGFQPWLDEENLLPGQLWKQEIPKALKDSDFILIFFSQTSVAKRGYVQREMKLALDAWEEIPEGQIHTIPVRLDDCAIPEQFQRFQRVDFSSEGGFERIVKAIQAGLNQRHQTKSATTQEPQDIERRLKFRVHRAFFVNNPVECYFLNLTNLSPNRVLEITHIWYEDGRHHIPVQQPSRPLPHRLQLDGTWETWIEVHKIPEAYHHNAYQNFRARITTGDVFRAEKNEDAPPYGAVPGGPVRSAPEEGLSQCQSEESVLSAHESQDTRVWV